MNLFARPAARKQQTAGSNVEPAPRTGRPAPGRPSDAHALLMRLQRSAGNRAVGRLLAQRREEVQPQRPDPANRSGGSTGRTPPIQRLVGFEVELSIPTFRNGKALALGKPWNPDHKTRRTADPLIRQFLTGGLKYDTPIGTLKTPTFRDTIRLKSDHDRLSDDGLDLYEVLIGKSAPPPEGSLAPSTGYVALSNLEYATDAVDELAPGSNRRFKAMADSIDADVSGIMNSLPEGRVTQIPNSNPATYTGIPLVELFSWIAGPKRGAYFPNDVDEAITKLMNHVTWYMSPQATVGIHPSGLQELYEAQTLTTPGGAPGSWAAAQKDAATAILDGVRRVRTDGTVGVAIDKWLEPAKPIDRRAVFGALLVGLSYVVGQAINATTLLDGSTRKNAVPYLVKVADIGTFTSGASTDWLRANKPSPTLVKDIATWFHANVRQTNVDYWQAPPYSAQASTKRKPVIRTSKSPNLVTAYLLYQILAGGQDLKVVGPGTALPGPDPVSTHIGGSGGVSGQRGLPLEYRWIPTHPTGAGQLWKVFQEVLGQVRYAQLKYRSKETIERIGKSLD